MRHMFCHKSHFEKLEENHNSLSLKFSPKQGHGQVATVYFVAPLSAGGIIARFSADAKLDSD